MQIRVVKIINGGDRQRERETEIERRQRERETEIERDVCSY